MECSGAKVFIDVEEYDKLREFKRQIEGGNVYCVTDASYEYHITEFYLEKNEAVDELKKLYNKDIERKKIRLNNSLKEVKEKHKLNLDELSMMSIWDFKRWRKKHNKNKI